LLIIFDLDDTLIDTSGCITPIKLEHALHKMVEHGLVLPNLLQALEMIKRLNEVSESGKSTLAEFLEIHDADSRFLDIGIRELYENFSSDFHVSPLDHALDVLLELKEDHRLALVTRGQPEIQRLKLKKAGIDSSLFSKIIACSEGGKKSHYQAIREEFDYHPSEVIVCGDRIAVDLTPAKELGFKTVHMRWGRGLNSVEPKSDVDYTISHFLEFKEIMTQVTWLT
jgi:putative hydrolase of the HAD superfamily